MGRQNKVGLDYFELDCHMEEKIDLIEAEYGLKGFAIVVKLYQSIYSGFGYYCEWTPDISVLWARRLGLSHGGDFGKVGIASNDGSLPGFPKNLINDVIAASIRRNIFSKELFDRYSILTSHGIQERYLSATSKREKIEWIKEYLLVSIPKNRKNVVINSISSAGNAIYGGRNKQSREEKSKEENNIIVATSGKPKETPPTFEEDSFEIRCVDILIKSCLETFPNSKVPIDLTEKKKWAIEIERMKRIDKRSESDIMAALNFAVNDSFWKANIRSGKKFREKFETLIVQSKGNARAAPIGKQNSFNQFPQRDYDYEELERKLLNK